MIIKGLKFKSKTFSALAEVSEIRESKNEVDVLFTPSDGHSWIEKGMDLNLMKSYFNSGVYSVYKVPDTDKNIYII
jgi:hypothetical protein